MYREEKFTCVRSLLSVHENVDERDGLPGPSTSGASEVKNPKLVFPGLWGAPPFLRGPGSRGCRSAGSPTLLFKGATIILCALEN